MQNAEPLSLFCADETDGESLRACEQINESLYALQDRRHRRRPGPGHESARANADSTIWTCKLRDGVKFHDGAALDANDVVASYAVQWDAEHPLHKGRASSLRLLARPVGRLPQPAGRLGRPLRAERTSIRGAAPAARPVCPQSSVATGGMSRQPMTQFIVRRLLVTIPVLLGIVFIVFALARIVPGDPCRAVLGERAPPTRASVRRRSSHRYGLDQPDPRPVRRPTSGSSPQRRPRDRRSSTRGR